jgi:hypothetical protein
MFVPTTKLKAFKLHVLKVHNPLRDHYDDNIKAMIIVYVKHHGMSDFGNQTQALVKSLGIIPKTYTNWMLKHNDHNAYRDFMPRAIGQLILIGLI